MEFANKNTMAVPLALAPPSVGTEQDDIQYVVQGFEEQAWSPGAFSSFDDNYTIGFDDEERHVNLFYRLLTSYVMPFFLLLQWVLEVYDEDNDFTYDISWEILLGNVIIFGILMFFYRKAVAHNIWALLAPVVFLLIADTLVLFHFATIAIWVMVGGLVGMAGTIVIDFCYHSRGDEEQEVFIDSREWMLKEDLMGGPHLSPDAEV